MDGRDPKRSLKDAIAQYQAMVQELERFIAASERVFLGAGSSLQHLESKANRLLAEASSATRLGGSDDNPTEDLRQGLVRLEQHLQRGQSDTEKGLGALGAVLGGIEKLLALQNSFDGILATLNALASTTHLEDSRLGGGRGGFDSVVSDLRNMSVQIKPRFNEVMYQSRAVRHTAQEALAKAKGFLVRHREDVSSLRRGTRDHLASMSAACQTSGTLANEASRTMVSLRASIASVLQALQIQDLSRQMIEHVISSLSDFVSAAQAAGSTSSSEDVARSWTAELAIVSRIEAAQVGNACDRLVRGLAQIDRSLQVVVAGLATLASQTSRFAGKDKSTSALRQLEQGIRETARTLRAHDTHESAMLRALGEVSDTAAGVEQLVDEVATLGKDARFIGLNAMVKAVRVGQSGLTLTVLAREIQDVSDQIQSFTGSAAGIMRSVGDEARLLASEHSGPSAGAGRGEEVAAELEALMAKLGQYQSSLLSAVEGLTVGSQDLHSQVSTTSDSLHGLIDKAKELRSLTTRLTAIQRQAVVDAAGAPPPEGRKHTEDARYTMEEERQVERAARGEPGGGRSEEIQKPADASSAEGSVEFF